MHWAAVYEVRMRNGTKKIFHLEAWVIKVMSIYKVRILWYSPLQSPDECGSIISMTWTLRTSWTIFSLLIVQTRLLYIESYSCL